jgi:hypothetical protein
VHYLEGGALKGMSPRVFPNLRRMHNKYWNLPLHKQLLFYFLAFFPKYFHENMGTYKIGGAPPT